MAASGSAGSEAAKPKGFAHATCGREFEPTEEDDAEIDDVACCTRLGGTSLGPATMPKIIDFWTLDTFKILQCLTVTRRSNTRGET